MLKMFPVSKIKVGRERQRKDLGDVKVLAASIADVRLINPIPVSPDGTLLARERRLAAVKQLGWTEVAVTSRRPFRMITIDPKAWALLPFELRVDLQKSIPQGLDAQRT
jgi:hypothetical protein